MCFQLNSKNYLAFNDIRANSISFPNHKRLFRAYHKTVKYSKEWLKNQVKKKRSLNRTFSISLKWILQEFPNEYSSKLVLLYYYYFLYVKKKVKEFFLLSLPLTILVYLEKLILNKFKMSNK